MLKRGDKVGITLYEGNDQVEELNWVVAEYDNGIARLERSGKEAKVVNLRSIGFLQAKIEND
jgi:hypothetical protein